MIKLSQKFAEEWAGLKIKFVWPSLSVKGWNFLSVERVRPKFHLIFNFERWVLRKRSYAEGKSSFKIIKTFPTKVVREGYYQGLELSGKCFYASISTLSGFMQKSIWIYMSTTRKVIWRRRKDILVRNLVHKMVSAWPNEVVRCSEVVSWGHLRRMERVIASKSWKCQLHQLPPLGLIPFLIVKVKVNCESGSQLDQ